MILMKSNLLTVWSGRAAARSCNRSWRRCFELEALEARYLLAVHVDTIFGDGGQVWAAGQLGASYKLSLGDWQSLSLGADGRILVSGDAFRSNSSDSEALAVRQFLPDGTEDANFQADLPGHPPMVQPQAISQPDGKSLVVFNQSIVRLNGDGSIDPTFSFVPSAQMQAINPYYDLYDPQLMSDGRVVVVLDSMFNVFAPTVVVRYLSNGNLDPTFGTNGESYQPGDDYAQWVRVQPDNKVLVLRVSVRNDATVPILSRQGEDGNPDTTFGDAGDLTLSGELWNGLSGAGIALEPDGGILVGLYDSVTNQPSIIRVTADGTIDGTFGDGGRITLPADATPQDMLLEPDGKLLVLCGFGSMTSTETGDLGLLRFNKDGTPDSEFGSSGTFQIPDTLYTGVFSSPETWLLMALQGNDVVILTDDAVVSTGGSADRFFNLIRVTERTSNTGQSGGLTQAMPGAIDEGTTVVSSSSPDRIFDDRVEELDRDRAGEVWD
jgi:uncharacterized delta-60 repeat protein